MVLSRHLRAPALALLAVVACSLMMPLRLAAMGDTGPNTGLDCVSILHKEAHAAGPLPSRLVDLRSPEGQRRLRECTHCASYPQLSVSYLSQVTQAFCAVASSVMVLNAGPGRKPLTPPYEPYRYFTQCNVFNETARQHIDFRTLENEGLTLAQARWLLTAQADTAARCLHAGRAQHDTPTQPGTPLGCDIAGDADAFIALATEALASANHFVLVNFSRKTLSDDGEGGGHFSPLGAYHAPSGSFLVMDVARYKYPPFWVDARLLWDALATLDSASQRHRGFVIVHIDGAPVARALQARTLSLASVSGCTTRP